MTIYHPFKVFISISLVQVIEDSRKPGLTASQKLLKGQNWSAIGKNNEPNAINEDQKQMEDVGVGVKPGVVEMNQSHL